MPALRFGGSAGACPYTCRTSVSALPGLQGTAMSEITEGIWQRFRYREPLPWRVEDHKRARELVCDVALELDELLPEGREKALVLTHLEEALFWANAAIARQPS